MVRGPIEVNFTEHRGFVEKVGHSLGKAKGARVTTPAGTDIYFDLRGRLEKVIIFTGLYDRPGDADLYISRLRFHRKWGGSRG